MALPLKLRVVEKSRAEKEGRAGKVSAAAEQPEPVSDGSGSEAGEDDEEDDEEGEACLLCQECTCCAASSMML